MNVKQLFLGLAVIAVLSVGGYLIYNKSKNDTGSSGTFTSAGMNDASRDLLSYVPADTVVFFGGLEPMPLQNMLDVLAPHYGWVKDMDFSRELAVIGDEPAGLKMVFGLSTEYVNLFKDIKSAAAKLGVGATVNSALYTVGAIPVMRIKLTDSAAFNAFIQRAETAVNVKPEMMQHAGVDYRTYSFSHAGSADSGAVKLVIGVNQDYAIITLNTPVEDGSTRNIILGSSKPNNSLAQQTILQDIQGKHGFHGAYLGYVNHQEIMKGLTASNSNSFGQMIDTIIKIADGGVSPASPLALIQTPACQTELAAITHTWPRTVFGYTKLDLNSKPQRMAARMLIENTDAAFMQQMQKLRGFIPASITDIGKQPVFGLGFGLNMDEVAPFIGTVVDGVAQKEYQCAVLAQMKQQLVDANPVLGIGMMSGMVAGIQGVSATVLDIDMDLNQFGAPDVKSLDAIITLSAKNPQTLLSTLGRMQPALQSLQIPADGTPVDFPLPLQLPNNEPVKLAMKGNHVVAYVGSRAAQVADSLAATKLDANGFMTIALDFGKYMGLINNFAANANIPGAFSAQDKKMFEGMANMKMQMVESFDISQDGIAVDVDMAMH